MIVSSEFIIHRHEAERAGKHFDLRFLIPNSKLWASFATKKGIPTEPNQKVMLYRTNDHSEKEAMMLGEIKEGYGKGHLYIFEKRSPCDILVYQNGKHIVIDFHGEKIKGIYHFLRLQYTANKARPSYLFFKAKDQDASHYK